jgi:hypothetical protein
MPEPWRRTTLLLLYGWMPAGIGWQLVNLDRIDAYSMLGWFSWPPVPAVYLSRWCCSSIGMILAEDSFLSRSPSPSSFDTATAVR